MRPNVVLHFPENFSDQGSIGELVEFGSVGEAMKDGDLRRARADGLPVSENGFNQVLANDLLNLSCNSLSYLRLSYLY